MKNAECVDQYFCRVGELPSAQLTPQAHALIEVWHSFGLIQNGGLHNYLCEIGSEAIKTAGHYRKLRLSRCAEMIESSYGLWAEYWPDSDPSDSDPDAFRRRFGHELDHIEREFYASEDEIVDQLAKFVSDEPSRPAADI